MPTDIVALQEVIWDCRPQVIVETGVARGGSVVASPSLLELLGENGPGGRRRHSRATGDHRVTPLAHRIELIEDPPVPPTWWTRCEEEPPPAAPTGHGGLDSNHTHEHVLAELRLYGPMVRRRQFPGRANTMVEQLPRR